MSGDAEVAAAALARDLLAWDRSPAQAAALRARVRGAAPFRYRGEATPGLRALAKATELYAKGADPASLGAWLIKEKNQLDGRLFAPLVGDPALGRWPFHDPLGLSERDLVVWARVFEQLRPCVDAEIRRVLQVAFHVRRRQTWPPVARAWAALALDDAELRDALVSAWADTFGDLGDRFPKTGLGRPTDGRGAHHRRHVLYLGCCWRALGRDDAGLAPGRLASMPLPTDDADRSVVVLGLTALARVAAAEIEPHLVHRARELGADELSEAAFRELAAALPPGPGSSAIRAALITPRWKPARADALWEWLHTAAWFAERGDADAVDQMTAAAGEAAEALGWRLGRSRPAEPVDALISRLGSLLDPDRFEVVPHRRRAALLAETRLLMRSDDVVGLAWPSVVRVAYPAAGERALRGTVADVGEPSLCVWLAERALTSRTLLRDVVLDPANVLRIGGIQDGFVAGQVAVQTERILRELGTDADRVRFLWNLLQQDPPHRTFAELGLVLRTDGHPLHPMVRAVSALDQRRDEGADTEAIGRAFADLVSCACALLGSDAPIAAALGGLARELVAAVVTPADPLDDEAWLDRFEAVVLGGGPGGGLVGWAAWLAADDPARGRKAAARCAEASVRLRAAVRMVRAARPAVTAEHHEELVAAGRALYAEIGPLGWPETRLVTALLDQLQARSAEALARGRRSRAAVESLDRVLERADEAALAGLIRDPAQLSLLPIDELKRMHRDLLGQLRFADAEFLRRAVADRVALPHRIVHLTPLFGAVAGGTFLVLDIADAWLSLVGDHSWAQVGATVSLALAGSYALLVDDLAPRVTTPGLSRLARWRLLAVRTLPTFAQASVVSVSTSAVVMGTLGRLAPTADALSMLGLWSALALFLGVFIGLVSQGQSATRSGPDDR